MSKDTRDLLPVLKAELAFVERGGYRHMPPATWRPTFIFQDSPTCLNFNTALPPKPCSDCVLVQLVPQQVRKMKIPCRYIPLNEQGETIDSFYRFGTREDLEAALRAWLRGTIKRLEEGKQLEATDPPGQSGEPEIHVRARATASE
ncbi:MAG TPA: hypothetical protein VMI32_20175 [Candidatus Solibacter sp.]|nr:hypothetical protein [Candidatus Solibacter sp.]